MFRKYYLKNIETGYVWHGFCNYINIEVDFSRILDYKGSGFVMKKILITSEEIKNEYWSETEKILSENKITPIFNKVNRAMTAKDICDVCSKHKIEGIIVYSSSDKINSKVLENCRDLKVISRHGVGIENIDQKSAEKNGVKIKTTNNVWYYETVADLTMGLMICVARNIAEVDQALRNKTWIRPIGTDVWGKTLGIVGLGRIGLAVARRAKGSKMRVLTYDPYVNENLARENGIEIVSLNSLLKESDFITLHLPLTNETKNIISYEQFEIMKKTAYLINAARADLVDQEALLEALENEKIKGAAIDVFSVEPAIKDPLVESNLHNLVLTSHIGSYTTDNLKQMDIAVIRNAIEILNEFKYDI